MVAYISFITSVFYPSAAFAQEQELATAEMRIRALAEATASNRVSFEYCTCHFVLRLGTAESLDSAVDGQLENVDAETTGVWVVDRDRLRYELIRPQHVVQQEKEQNRLRIVPLRVVKDSKRGVYFNEMIHGGTVYHPGHTGRPLEVTPFTMAGAMGAAAGLDLVRSVRRSLKDDRIWARYEGKRTIDGVPLEMVRFGVTDDDDQSDLVYLLDPARGFLPVQLWIQRPDGTVHSKAVVTDVRQCTGDRWFPMRCVYFRARTEDAMQGAGSVTVFQVTDLNVANRPSDDAFVVTIPKGAALHDGEKLGSQITLDAALKVGLDDAERLYNATQARYESYKRRIRE